MGKEIKYTYDTYGNLYCASFDAETIFRCMDSVGNVYNTKEQDDRIYGKGGVLLKSNSAEYEYDNTGSLIKKITKEGIWRYLYYSNGLMQKVIRPDGKEVNFKYDGLGRRIEKAYDGNIRKFLWDGDSLLHEWNEVDNVISNETTWIYKDEELVPIEKIDNNENYSIITNHLGTPIEMYDLEGEIAWSAELDIYGNIKKQEGDYDSCLIRFPGQYEDVETGLYYNRFRYYSPSDGIYTQQDPVGTNGGMVLYGYVNDTNIMADVFGLIPKQPIRPGVSLSGLNLITYKPTKVTPIPGSYNQGISRAWKLEQKLVRETGGGTYPWNDEQLKRLTNGKKVKGFTGHHINNHANGTLGDAFKGDPRNIRFLPNGKSEYNEHLYGERGHRGNYQNNTKGRLIDRQAMIDAAHKKKGI